VIYEATEASRRSGHALPFASNWIIGRPPTSCQLYTLWFSSGPLDRDRRMPILRALSDIIDAVDYGDVAALVLDLSPAFDMVDHDILLQQLQATFGISDVAHRWIRSYLSGRTERIISDLGRILAGLHTSDGLLAIRRTCCVQLNASVDLIPFIQSHDSPTDSFCTPTTLRCTAHVGMLT